MRERALGAAHARRRRAARSATRRVDEPDLVVPHPRWHERAFVLAPLADLGVSRRGAARLDRSAAHRPNIAGPVGPETGTRVGWNERSVRASYRRPVPRTSRSSGPAAPGTSRRARAGRRRVAAARGRRPIGRRGVDRGARSPGWACPPAPLADVGRGRVARGDRHARRRHRRRRRSTLAPGLEPGALVVHLAGARGLDALARCRRPPARRARRRAAPAPDVRRHPTPQRARRVVGCGRRTARGRRPRARARRCIRSSCADDRRAAYHAAAVVASNHLVALLGQVERLAAAAGVPLDAFLPARARPRSTTSRARGPAARAHRSGGARRRSTPSPPTSTRCPTPSATRTARWRSRRARARRARRRRRCAALARTGCARVIDGHPRPRAPHRVRRRPRARAVASASCRRWASSTTATAR